MRFNTKPLALVGGLLFLPAIAARAESNEQDHAIIQLLNLFATRSDPLAVAIAGKLVNEGMSPAKVVIKDLHAPFPSLGGWVSSESTNTSAYQLGDYVAKHPAEFIGKLPGSEHVSVPLRLGPFFQGVFPQGPSTSDLLEHELAALDPIFDAAWLQKAAECGAMNFQQLILVHRGQLQVLLLAYQESKNDIALILLGEALGNYAKAYQTIDYRGLEARTLAHLLAGSLGTTHSNPSERQSIIEIANRWVLVHPDLLAKLRELRDPGSLWLLEFRLLWEKDRKASMEQLLSNQEMGVWSAAQFFVTLLINTPLSEAEAVQLIHSLPTEMLDACSQLAKPGAPQSRQSAVAGWVASELHSRNVVGKES